MTINDLFLNVKDTSLSSVIRQTDIQTTADKLRYNCQGYNVALTEAEFRSRCPGIDPACVCYSPSIGLMCFYFNPETFAVCNLHPDLYVKEMAETPSEKLLADTKNYIRTCEEEAARGNFTSAIITLQDRMRLEFFSMLVEKKGTNIPNLYKQFFDAYTSSDYGFRGMDQDVLRAILETKTEDDKKRTAEQIKSLPQTVVVYRGGNTKSADAENGWSWTLDINTANFFASRRGNGPGYIAKAKVRKNDIVEAFLGARSAGESEIIVDSKNVHIFEVIPLHGLEYLQEMMPKINDTYAANLTKLHSLSFSLASEAHGASHSARVLLLTQLIAEELGLSERDRRLLAKAAVYHDTRRTHDGDDEQHGEAASRYYWQNEMVHNPIVSFLCEYHCLPDGDALEKIRRDQELAKYGKDRVLLLWKIFKDADALDRVRFDIRDLDLNQLRLPISQELTLVARMCFEGIKI